MVPLSGAGAGVAKEVAQGFGAVVRFSGSGDGLLHQDCNDEAVCGLLNRPLEDPDADVRPGEPDRLVSTFNEELGGSAQVPSRLGFDIQHQTLPVIYLPGFLGSEITCSGRSLWPGFLLPDPLGMRLTPGQNNFGCAAAGPGDPVKTIFGKDIYGTVGNYVTTTLEPGRGTMFGWDWRKNPQATLDRLDKAVDDALERPGRWKDQGAKRVVLMGHSYGGLMIRAYQAAHPEKVARVMTAGTPYWGAPKALFPLAFGIESPEIGPMDFLFRNKDLKRLAVDLGGLYQLYPSRRYPAGWLSLNGALIDPARSRARSAATRRCSAPRRATTPRSMTASTPTAAGSTCRPSSGRARPRSARSPSPGSRTARAPSR